MIKPEDAFVYYWDGLLRSYKRLKEIEEGRSYESNFESELDMYYCFFMRCYHLKDWLIKTIAPNAKNAIEQFINDNPELSLCADICNATKHFTLEGRRGRRPKRLVSLLAGADGIALFREYDPNSGGIRKYRIRIEETEKRWEAIELSTACVRLWRGFIQQCCSLKLPG